MSQTTTVPMSKKPSPIEVVVRSRTHTGASGIHDSTIAAQGGPESSVAAAASAVVTTRAWKEACICPE